MSLTPPQNADSTHSLWTRIQAHAAIARFDHWVKNIFLLPGIVVALSVEQISFDTQFVVQMIIAFVAVGLVASSNYVINEVLDAPFDKHHPSKHARPVPSGRVHIFWAYVQWFAMMLIGVALGTLVGNEFTIVLVVLWIMGIIYNVRPLRSKDVAYLDVLSEAINNPIRMFAGWYIVNPSAFPPASMLLSYWMVGCYLMAIKRYAEYHNWQQSDQAAAYRKSFAHYTDQRLLVSIMFYAASSMLFLGAFIMRYRLELILSFPLVAAVMSIYLALAFKEDSAVQAPEKLYRERTLMFAVVTCAAAMATLMVVDVPWMHAIFEPTAPVVSANAQG